MLTADLSTDWYHFGMTTSSVRIPDELHARLVAFAKAKHISTNSAIVSLVEDGLARDAQAAAIAKASDDIFTRRRELFERLADA
jgi:predicted transcriptional regulator